MADQRTTITELVTGLGTLGYGSLAEALAARPAEMVSMSPEQWCLLEELHRGGAFGAEFLGAWQNGVAFLAAADGLRGRRPLTVEWRGAQKQPGDEPVPADLRIDHVFLVSCKYLSKIVTNTSPTTVFDRLLAGGHGQGGTAPDWFAEVAPAAYQDLYEATLHHLATTPPPTPTPPPPTPAPPALPAAPAAPAPPASPAPPATSSSPATPATSPPPAAPATSAPPATSASPMAPATSASPASPASSATSAPSTASQATSAPSAGSATSAASAPPAAPTAAGALPVTQVAPATPASPLASGLSPSPVPAPPSSPSPAVLLGLPAKVVELQADDRARLQAGLGRGRWPAALRPAAVAFSTAVAEASAARWQAALDGADVERALWRLLRIGSAPYFVLGASSEGSLRLRIATAWDWRQHFRIDHVTVTPTAREQPVVLWSVVVTNRRSRQVSTIEGHVEIRWSHGKFAQRPEAKVYLDTPHHRVPGYWPLTPGSSDSRQPGVVDVAPTT